MYLPSDASQCYFPFLSIFTVDLLARLLLAQNFWFELFRTEESHLLGVPRLSLSTAESSACTRLLPISSMTKLGHRKTPWGSPGHKLTGPHPDQDIYIACRALEVLEGKVSGVDLCGQRRIEWPDWWQWLQSQKRVPPGRRTMWSLPRREKRSKTDRCPEVWGEENRGLVAGWIAFRGIDILILVIIPTLWLFRQI